MSDRPTPAEIDAAERVLLGWNVTSPRARLREVARQALVAACALDPLRHSEGTTHSVTVGHSDTSPERRARLERIAFQRLGYVGASSAEQVQAIVDRALDDPPPIRHPHSYEETGMCTECDAAWVLAVEAMELEEDDG